MQKIEKMKSNMDFRRLYGRGKSYVTPFFVLYVRKNGGKKIRLGITAGKKIGGAVQRNRAKRLIYAAFSECLPHIAAGHDFVIVARHRILSIKSFTVAAAIKKQLKAAELWCDYESDKQIADSFDKVLSE